MKYLLIIRHAKSSWALPGQDDFERPLNERGKSDAPMMAKRLLNKNVTIDLFISSPANRALTTAVFFAEKYNVPRKKIEQVPKLYHAPPSVFYDVIKRIPGEVATAAIFSHNPGITEFVNELTPTQIDNMPTCAIFGISADINDWKDFTNAEKSYWFFDYPKL